MANTAPKVAEAERFEDLDVVDEKAQTLAQQIKKSKHFIVYTGAGISTSAGIPDFRGPDGHWTLMAQGRHRTGKTVDTLQAIPTPTHMALVELQKRGVLKYLVSQNCDGLHRRSGIAPDMISELHGNTNREYCETCGKEYLRGLQIASSHYDADFRAVAADHMPATYHRTGRKCPLCGGFLRDSIVNFGENLPEEAFRLACQHAGRADLCLVLGSSCTVTPANEIPQAVGEAKKGSLAICNLQSTPLDSRADVRVFAPTDDFMTRVMDKLELPIPMFILRRQLRIGMETAGTVKAQLAVRGVDVDGTPASFIKEVRLAYNRRTLRSEPFVIGLRGELEPGTELKLELQFMGHYGEPNLEVVYRYTSEPNTQVKYLLEYNPQNGEWEAIQMEMGE